MAPAGLGSRTRTRGDLGIDVERLAARRHQAEDSRSCMKPEDGIDLADDDFRRFRRYLAPWLFADNPGDATTYPPPDDLMPEEQWDGVIVLPTDVALKTSSWMGTPAARLAELHGDWIFSCPEMGKAAFMDEICLLAGDEFDALVFNALHGYYRQAIGCLRNALEMLAAAAALSVRSDHAAFTEWRTGAREIPFRDARAWLRDSPDGASLDGDTAPESIFGDAASSWLRVRYRRLCAYAHSQPGYNNADFWESNGPIFVPRALSVVEMEFRETLALAYLLLRLGWPGYAPGRGQAKLLAGPQVGWTQYDGVLRRWLQVS